MEGVDWLIGWLVCCVVGWLVIWLFSQSLKPSVCLLVSYLQFALFNTSNSREEQQKCNLRNRARERKKQERNNSKAARDSKKSEYFEICAYDDLTSDRRYNRTAVITCVK